MSCYRLQHGHLHRKVKGFEADIATQLKNKNITADMKSYTNPNLNVSLTFLSQFSILGGTEMIVFFIFFRILRFFVFLTKVASTKLSFNFK